MYISFSEHSNGFTGCAPYLQNAHALQKLFTTNEYLITQKNSSMLNVTIILQPTNPLIVFTHVIHKERVTAHAFLTLVREWKWPLRRIPVWWWHVNTMDTLAILFCVEFVCGRTRREHNVPLRTTSLTNSIISRCDCKEHKGTTQIRVASVN